MRVFFIMGCFAASAIVAVYGQPLVHENPEAITIIITVMTVFAGFLVAIIAVLGDPAMIPNGSWRVAESRRTSIEARLIVHVWLFIFYLVAIGLLFIGVLVSKSHDISIGPKVWIERAYLFFGVSSFLFTFALPHTLIELQMTRIDAEIDERRRDANISDD